MTRNQFIRTVLSLAASGAIALHAAEVGHGRTVRVLTVGNSFSQNATRYLGDIAKAAGDTLILHGDDVGGASMELHWGKVQSFEKDPADKNGRYSGGKSLREDLQGGRWDFVTIQQASLKSHDLATYRPFAKQLADYIRTHAPGATLLLHQTWEYRVDDPRFSVKEPKPGEPRTQDEMFAGLTNAYSATAKDIGVRLIPVGDAFHAANRDAQWGYRAPSAPFDASKAKPGELPEQLHSLNVGWEWTKQKDGSMKLAMDGHHANTAGEFLGACVWYEVMFGRSVEGNTFRPPGLDAAHAKFLRETAHRAVQQHTHYGL